MAALQAWGFQLAWYEAVSLVEVSVAEGWQIAYGIGHDSADVSTLGDWTVLVV